MNLKNVTVPLANFSGIVILVLIIAFPFLVANRIVQVAGVKTSVYYLISSQIQYFPNVSLSQEGQIYSLTYFERENPGLQTGDESRIERERKYHGLQPVEVYSKTSPSQLFQSLLILTNPTGSTQNYNLVTVSGQDQLFFGEDIENQIIKIALPSGASTPISLLSDDLRSDQSSKLDFSIEVN